MSTQLHPPLEGHTRANRPHTAQQARPEVTLGAPKGVAEGVRSAVRPDPQIRTHQEGRAAT